MNVLLFESDELGADALLSLNGQRGHYLREVQQVEPGFTLRVGEINGPMGMAEVIAVNPSEVLLKVGELTQIDSPMNLTLVLGLPRPQSLKKVLETIATFGVRRLVLTGAHRVQKSYFESKVLGSEQLEKHLRLGMEQGVGTTMPEVKVIKRFSQLELPQEIECKLLATPSAEVDMTQLQLHKTLNTDTPLVLAVGPEGGWAEREIEWFVKHEFSSFNIGKRVLRVETAVAALLGQITLLQQMTHEGMVRD